MNTFISAYIQMSQNIKSDEERPQNIRRSLLNIRQRWDQHSPTNPFCLAEEIEPNLTISDFCVSFLMAQRSRRMVNRKLDQGKTRSDED